MYRGKQVYFSASKEVIQQLFECNRISANVWNACLDEAKNFHKSHGKWIGKSQLQFLVKGKYLLHSQSIQAVVTNTCLPEAVPTKLSKKVLKESDILISKRNISIRMGRYSVPYLP